MTAKEMREFQKSKQRLIDGEHAELYKRILKGIEVEVTSNPSIEYVEWDNLPKPVADRLRLDGYTVEYHQSGQIEYCYRITWDN